jgi:hypothetical protein
MMISMMISVLISMMISAVISLISMISAPPKIPSLRRGIFRQNRYGSIGMIRITI